MLCGQAVKSTRRERRYSPSKAKVLDAHMGEIKNWHPQLKSGGKKSDRCKTDFEDGRSHSLTGRLPTHEDSLFDGDYYSNPPLRHTRCQSDTMILKEIDNLRRMAEYSVGETFPEARRRNGQLQGEAAREEGTRKPSHPYALSRSNSGSSLSSTISPSSPFRNNLSDTPLSSKTRSPPESPSRFPPDPPHDAISFDSTYSMASYHVVTPSQYMACPLDPAMQEASVSTRRFLAQSPGDLRPPTLLNPMALGGWGRGWEIPFMHKAVLSPAPIGANAVRRENEENARRKNRGNTRLEIDDSWLSISEGDGVGSDVWGNERTVTGPKSSRWSATFSDIDSEEQQQDKTGPTEASRIRDAYLKSVSPRTSPPSSPQNVPHPDPYRRNSETLSMKFPQLAIF
ncbi:hypothetical protein L204_104302 [Cryptococcus depauperatus]|nr:hypothetical protein L204_04873 [Cryptococcus depauperatus CBS 7855]